MAKIGSATDLSRREFLGVSAAAALALAAPGQTAPAGAPKPGPSLPPWPPVRGGSMPAVILSDMRAALPPGAGSPVWDDRQWKVYPYQSGLARGFMIAAGQNSDCPDVELPLPVKGWHGIHIGLVSMEGYSRIQLKLARDRAFVVLTDQNLVPRLEYERAASLYTTKAVKSYFWKYADLDGDKMILRQLKVMVDPDHPESRANFRFSAYLAYVVLSPLSTVEAAELSRERSRRETGRLIATHDGTGSASLLSWYTEDDIRRDLEPFRDTDFFRIDFEGGKGDLTHYPSKIGRMVAFEWEKAQYSSLERMTAVSYRTLREKGIDPFRVALEYAHRIGLEFHASYRVAGFLYQPPRDERSAGGLFWRHPEWRGINRQGKLTPRLSYAYAGLRRWVIGLLREMAEYPIDGVSILFNRRPPIVEYEPPIVDSFRKKLGLDPRSIEATDPRWLAHRSAFVTEFMREVRLAMDEIGGRRGRKRIQVTAVVFGTEAMNLFYGMDVRAWIRDGLVDWIIPYQSGADLLSSRDSFTDPRDVAPLVELARGSGCKIAPNIMPRELAPAAYMQRAAGLYEQGVDGLYLWDGYSRCDYSDSWRALRRLGHREELAAWVRAGKPPPVALGTDRLLQVGEWDMAYDSAS